MIREWFDAREAVAFAQQIAHDINAAFSESGKTKATSAKKHQKKLDSIFLRTGAFARDHSLNVYKKAKFLNTVKWHLRDAGYDDAFINEIVGLLTPLFK